MILLPVPLKFLSSQIALQIQKQQLDLMAQSEHDSDASGVLISDSDEIIANVKEIISTEIDSLERCSIIKESISSNGLIIKIDNLSEAKQLVNKIVEHLHIAFDINYQDENSLIAGLILKGENSANSFLIIF